MSYFADSFDDKIVGLLKSGAVGLLPADTIYGLSCRALDREACEKIYTLKDRTHSKPLIILISDLRMLDLLSINKEQAKAIKKCWPGPLSVIFDAPDAPAWLLCGGTTLAVRWPAGENLNQLIKKTGPLVSTSANPEAGTPAASVADAKRYFGSRLDFYVDVGELKSNPSTMVRIKNGRAEIIRQGSLKISG